MEQIESIIEWEKRVNIMKKILITILASVFLCTIYACNESNSDSSSSIDSDNSITSENSNSSTGNNDSAISTTDAEDNSINAAELLKKYNEILTYYNSKIKNQKDLATSYSHNMYQGSSAEYSADLDSIEKELESAYILYEKQKKAYYTKYKSYGYTSTAAQELAEREASANYKATRSAVSARKSELSMQWENRIKYEECLKRITELENERDLAIQELLNGEPME